MPKSSGNPRCKCCDEVMEELLTMRQTFEKLFHRLTKQIVDLRREVTEGIGNMSSGTALKRESSSSPTAPSPQPPSFKQFNESESETECISLKKENKKASTSKNSLNVNKEETKDPVDVKTVSRPVLDFYNIQARVMPTQPFKTAQQFEDWNAIFKQDEDQCDQLRVELLQGHFDEPDKYIKHIWRSVFKNDAAEKYSYRGNGRCKKRAIKNYIFTDIFRECFLQRFHHMDATFFMERTMRYFNYVHDQWRKRVRNQRGSNAKSKNDETVENAGGTQDEQSFNGFEGSMFE